MLKKTCLITQTGARSTFSPLAALSNLSLSRVGKFSAVNEVISEGCNSIKSVGNIFIDRVSFLDHWVLIMLHSRTMVISQG